MEQIDHNYKLFETDFISKVTVLKNRTFNAINDCELVNFQELNENFLTSLQLSLDDGSFEDNLFDKMLSMVKKFNMDAKLVNEEFPNLTLHNGFNVQTESMSTCQTMECNLKFCENIMTKLFGMNYGIHKNYHLDCAYISEQKISVLSENKSDCDLITNQLSAITEIPTVLKLDTVLPNQNAESFIMKKVHSEVDAISTGLVNIVPTTNQLGSDKKIPTTVIFDVLLPILNDCHTINAFQSEIINGNIYGYGRPDTYSMRITFLDYYKYRYEKWLLLIALAVVKQITTLQNYIKYCYDKDKRAIKLSNSNSYLDKDDLMVTIITSIYNHILTSPG